MARPKQRQNQKRRRKISIEMTSFITQPATVQPSPLTRPMHRKERDPKLGNSSGTRPDRVHSDRQPKRPISFMYRLGLDLFNPWTLDRNRPCHTTFSPHVRSTGFCERGLCITPSWRRASRKPTKDQEPPIGSAHSLPWSCTTQLRRLYGGRAFLPRGRDESDWQGPRSIGGGLLLGQEPGE